MVNGRWEESLAFCPIFESHVSVVLFVVNARHMRTRVTVVCCLSDSHQYHQCLNTKKIR